MTEPGRNHRTGRNGRTGQNWRHWRLPGNKKNTSPHFQFFSYTDTECEGKHGTTQKNEEGKRHQPERGYHPICQGPKDQWCCSLPLGWYCSPFSPLWQCCFGWCCIPILLWCGAAFTSWVVLLLLLLLLPPPPPPLGWWC